jgi:hypothetical protein
VGQDEWLADAWYEWLWIMAVLVPLLLGTLLMVAYAKMKTGQQKKDEGDAEDGAPPPGSEGKTFSRTKLKAFVKSVETTFNEGARGDRPYTSPTWALIIVQGPFSAAPCRTLTLRFATFFHR